MENITLRVSRCRLRNSEAAWSHVKRCDWTTGMRLPPRPTWKVSIQLRCLCVLNFAQLDSHVNFHFPCQATWEDLSRNFLSTLTWPWFFQFQWEGLYGKGVLYSQTWRENRALKMDWIMKGFHLLAEGEICPVASQKLESSDDPEISGRQKFNNRISSNTHREMTSSVLYRVFTLNRWNTVQSF